MKFTTISALIALSGTVSNANIADVPESELGTCFKITPNVVTLNQNNLPKLVCFDSSLPENDMYSEIESYLEANNVKKQDVILAQWCEIKD
jgi:hypothetical protein